MSALAMGYLQINVALFCIDGDMIPSLQISFVLLWVATRRYDSGSNHPIA
jgi:hypothetical protein